jgi:SPP1 gp7 family putative phage head morphogenesis protein
LISQSHTHDRAKPETAKERRSFERVRRAEAAYARGLRQIARHVGELVRTMAPAPGDMAAASLLRAALNQYSLALRPWATVASARMLADVSRRDESVWANLTETMGRELRKEIQGAPTGHFLRGMLQENVDLITSLPTKAAERVHKLTMAGLSQGTRADDISREIMRTGEVTQSRANLIARTEVARSASGLVEVRSLHVGSEGYIWRTAEDADVRKEHKALNGKFIRWDSPPVAGSNGERAHAGQIYNCRCFPEPVIPEEKAA